MQTDVSASAPRTTDGQMLDNSGNPLVRTRVKAVYIVPNGTSGSVVFHDGGVSGPIKLTLNTITGATASDYIEFPGEGILFSTDVYADVTNVASVMIIYG